LSSPKIGLHKVNIKKDKNGRRTQITSTQTF
jgi:hypothetical protein